MDILKAESQITALLKCEEPGFFFPGGSGRKGSLDTGS